nr:mechanosensitive ion channel family protein [Mangrovicoccus sp. HB161399]
MLVRTDSPRDTLQSFLELRDEMERQLLAYLAAPSLAGAHGLALLSDQMVALQDLELVPPVARRETGIETGVYLMDIFGRLPAPDLSALPDTSGLESEEARNVRIPGTPLRIVLMEDGDREGEYLFSGQTVQSAPRFYRSIRYLPLRTALPIESFASFSPQLTGPLVPPGVLAAIPPSLRTLWLGTPAWKVLAFGIVTAIGIVAVAQLHRAVSARPVSHRVLGLAVKALVPLALAALAVWLLPFAMFQINLAGDFAEYAGKAFGVVLHIALAWLFAIAVRMAAEWLILSPRIPDESLDANLLRLLSGLIGIVGATIILAFGGQAIGLPIASVLAGLGIGGLAVALALRPTLENLVGGVMLYVDRPVRVGDFCCFGGQMGTVEVIGIRSTRIRALDRTLISVPNAQFADMQIINFSKRDRLLIDETLGLRYDTGADAMRTVIDRIRAHLAAEPSVEPATLRVRFTGYGESALNVNVRIYIMTVDFDEFLAIRERLFLDIFGIVQDCGTDFAFPSQTVYLSGEAGPALSALQAGAQREPA